jgi:hypothetical protein
VNYALKTVRARRVDDDTTIILPRAREESRSNSVRLESKMRDIKAIRASINVSPEVAEHIYLRRLNR